MSETKHNHRAAFQRTPGCPRCEEIAAAIVRNDTIAFRREEVMEEREDAATMTLEELLMPSLEQVQFPHADREGYYEQVTGDDGVVRTVDHQTWPPPTLDQSTGHGAVKGNYTLSQAEWDDRLNGPSVAPPSIIKVMCWLCGAQGHDLLDCPDREKAEKSGGTAAAVIRAELRARKAAE